MYGLSLQIVSQTPLYLKEEFPPLIFRDISFTITFCCHLSFLIIVNQNLRFFSSRSLPFLLIDIAAISKAFSNSFLEPTNRSSKFWSKVLTRLHYHFLPPMLPDWYWLQFYTCKQFLLRQKAAASFSTSLTWAFDFNSHPTFSSSPNNFSRFTSPITCYKLSKLEHWILNSIKHWNSSKLSLNLFSTIKHSGPTAAMRNLTSSIPAKSSWPSSSKLLSKQTDLELLP